MDKEQTRIRVRCRREEVDRIISELQSLGYRDEGARVKLLTDRIHIFGDIAPDELWRVAKIKGVEELYADLPPRQ